MTPTSRVPRFVGCSVQSAVEAKHHLIVAHQVRTRGYDCEALSTMAREARSSMEAEEIEATADKGYFKACRRLDLI